MRVVGVGDAGAEHEQRGRRAVQGQLLLQLPVQVHAQGQAQVHQGLALLLAEDHAPGAALGQQPLLGAQHQ